MVIWEVLDGSNELPRLVGSLKAPSIVRNGNQTHFDSYRMICARVLETELLRMECEGQRGTKEWFKAINIVGVPLRIYEIAGMLFILDL